MSGGRAPRTPHDGAAATADTVAHAIATPEHTRLPGEAAAQTLLLTAAQNWNELIIRLDEQF
jgi:hypothetical protein